MKRQEPRAEIMLVGVIVCSVLLFFPYCLDRIVLLRSFVLWFSFCYLMWCFFLIFFFFIYLFVVFGMALYSFLSSKSRGFRSPIVGSDVLSGKGSQCLQLYICIITSSYFFFVLKRKNRAKNMVHCTIHKGRREQRIQIYKVFCVCVLWSWEIYTVIWAFGRIDLWLNVRLLSQHSIKRAKVFSYEILSIFVRHFSFVESMETEKCKR